ncbi:MAG TPA: hypothetical protein DD727_03975 [Clostridiales bacterium]|nr:hypothetical protein [Clostridiales bacterium]
MMETAAALGCGVFVCGCNYIPELSYYENCTAAIRLFQRLMERGKALGVRIATYNCRSNNFVCEPMAWKIIHGHLKDLGIKYDPSHSIYDGGDYLTETAEWGSRFLHVHIKGSLRIGGRKFDDPPAGLDETDWGQFIAILIARGYDAGLSIEPHSPNWTGERGNRGVDFTIRYLRERMF